MATPIVTRLLRGGSAVTGHTVKAYDRELQALAGALGDMGGLARQMVVDALESIVAADVARALEVVAMGARLGELQRQIEYDAFLTIARRAPVALDLREVVAAIRISGDLGRVAAHAQDIAKRAVKIGAATRVPRAILGLRHMGALADELLKEALDAYAKRDAERARDIWVRDADLDSLEGSVFRDLLSQMIEDPRAISFCANTMSVSKASSGSATTPPTSPRPSSIWSRASRCRTSGLAARGRPASIRSPMPTTFDGTEDSA